MKATHHPSPTTPAEVLRAAVVYLQRYGWTRRTFFAPLTDGAALPAADIAGAICIAATGQQHPLATPPGPDGHLAITAMRHLAVYLDRIPAPFADVVPDIADVIGDWNDEHGHKLPELLDLLNAAADDWDRQHNQGGDTA